MVSIMIRFVLSSVKLADCSIRVAGNYEVDDIHLQSILNVTLNEEGTIVGYCSKSKNYRVMVDFKGNSKVVLASINYLVRID